MNSEEKDIIQEEEQITPSAIEKCETERKEYLDGWQRAKADHINYKNDEGKRMEDMARFLLAGVLQDLLPILDSFDLALMHASAPDTEKGILLIRSQLEDTLKKRGVEKISVSSGEIFNPEVHESIGETASNEPEGTIAAVIQQGYTLRGKVIRPARVHISKGPQL